MKNLKLEIGEDLEATIRKSAFKELILKKMFSTGKSKFFSGKEGLESLPLTRERPSLGLPIPCLGEAHLKSSPNVK